LYKISIINIPNLKLFSSSSKMVDKFKIIYITKDRWPTSLFVFHASSKQDSTHSYKVTQDQLYKVFDIQNTRASVKFYVPCRLYLALVQNQGLEPVLVHMLEPVFTSGSALDTSTLRWLKRRTISNNMWRRKDKWVLDIRLPGFRPRGSLCRKAYKAHEDSGLAWPRSNTWRTSKASKSSSWISFRLGIVQNRSDLYLAWETNPRPDLRI
jgi:hypothetical protein